MFKKEKKVYLDYAGATPISLKVIKMTSFYQSNFFANPTAIHQEGVKAKEILEKSRAKISSLLNAHSDEIIFTGSGTESDALAILGTICASQKEYFFRSSEKGDGSGARPFKNTLSVSRLPHIVTTNIEHPAVLENIKLLQESGRAEVTYLSVDEKGIVNLKDVQEALKENTILVSIMYANNEIGTIQPIREIAKIIRYFKKNKCSKKSSLEMPWERDGASTRNFSAEKYPCIYEEDSLRNRYPLFHTDACQAMNYLFVENLEKLGVDLMTFNGSKIYGPKGIGVLYKKRGIQLAPLYAGGGQEFNLRSGTENVAAVAGISLALEEVFKIKEKEILRLKKLRDYTIDKLLALSSSSFQIILNGDSVQRLPNNINISISNISSELLVIELDACGIQVSEKSACQSSDDNKSYVIQALRKTCRRRKEEEIGSLRISLGQQTTEKDIEYLVFSLNKILEKYKKWKDI